MLALADDHRHHSPHAGLITFRDGDGPQHRLTDDVVDLEPWSVGVEDRRSALAPTRDGQSRSRLPQPPVAMALFRRMND
jgi:hypothetical protein